MAIKITSDALNDPYEHISFLQTTNDILGINFDEMLDSIGQRSRPRCL